MELNEKAGRLCRELAEQADWLRVSVHRDHGAACVIDCGVQVAGGLEAGRRMAEICLAGLGSVQLTTGEPGVWRGPWLAVRTDQPVAACMASQYAGWPMNYEGFFAMASGPMRAARGREPLFEKIGIRDQARHVVGVLESSRLPPPHVCDDVARQCGVGPEEVTLLVAPTTSIAGTVQVVARSVETALHKMMELGFDVGRVVSGVGEAPLPPVAGDGLAAIGRTNDAILYGGRVTLWVRGDDASLREIGPRIPSSASADHGRTFAEVFARYGRDFYRIDPLLFSPAEVQLVNLDSGRLLRFGRPEPGILEQSFGNGEGPCG
ncbi:MAG: methenyltetrahydromethanopterin cyclohydrolase [Planctomycetes bacterium]|nr:methenyltetrahydromethanopterin cyclohydrolase [Planctomycetota bacterium]